MRRPGSALSRASLGGAKLRIELPWPPSVLSPNARTHWAPKAKAVAAYRSECGWRARAQGLYPMETDCLPMTITFCPPDARLHDKSNLIGRFKAGEDGLMDACGIDDRHFVQTYRMGETVKGGAVIVDIADA